MKLTQITYRRLFNTGSYTNEAVELTGSLSENEDVMQAYTELHKMAKELHYSQNPVEEEMKGTHVKDLEPVDKKGSFIQVINMATSKQALERFKASVDRENIPELTEAYNNKLKSFDNV